MFERYLCLGSTEVANSTRTLTYLRNLGHPFLTSPPNPECGDCFSNERGATVCSVPYAVAAGFDTTVTGEIAAQVWEMFRGAEPVTQVGVHREVSPVAGGPAVRPPVPTSGWVVSDYADPFTLPLLLSVDDVADCDASACRFERWVIYDIERWPMPHTAEPAPGEGTGTVTVLFYVDACSAPTGFGLCSVSFDGGDTWADMPGQTIPGHASGSLAMDVACITLPVTFTFRTTDDGPGFCHQFEYADGGSGSFEVQMWQAPDLFTEKPPLLPIEVGSSTMWVLGGLGSITEGAVTVEFPPALCATWDNPTGGYFMFWRYIDRVTRAVYELVIGINSELPVPPVGWNDWVSYSLDGGDTWHTPSTANPMVMVTPVPVVPSVPTVSNELTAAINQPFTDPATDLAPWYDPAVPESADVYGVWIEEFNSPVPYKREVRERRWGGSLPAATMTSREIHLTGYVYTRSCEATEYAKHWLFEALAQESCGDCDLPDAIVYRGCNPETNSAEHARTVRRVGLVAYNPELDPEFPCCLGFKFEATLRAEVPYLYRDPVLVYEGPIVNLDDEPVCNICDQCPEPTPPYSCGCLEQTSPRVQTTTLNECYCAPATVRRFFVPIEAGGYVWSDATVRLTLTVGGHLPGHDREAIRNLRIAAYPNPLGLVSPLVNGANYFECQDPCLEVEVSCLPPSAELVVDGTTRRSTVNVGPVALNGYGYLSSGGGGLFKWPDVGCNGLMLAIDSDAVFTGDGAVLRVELVPRERA